MAINISLQPIQDRLWDIYEHGEATKIGFGGPRGGTKSHSADVIMLMRRYKYPGTNGLFIMRVYQDMLDIHIRPLFDAYPELEKLFNNQQMLLRLPNGSYIRFLSGDSLATFQSRKGRGFADVMIDQSELFSQEEIQFLYTINRSTKPGITPKMLLCFNPGGLGHTYHKRIFYDRVFEQDEDPKEFAYLESKGWDNAYWSIKQMADRNGLQINELDELKIKQLVKQYHTLEEDERFQIFIKTDYGKTLNGLPYHKRRAELYGDMDIFEGMFFADFLRQHHVIEDYKHTDLRKTLAGLDYGNTTVLSILQRDTAGTIVVSDELYLPDLTNPTDRANAIADHLIDRGYRRLEIIYDTDMEISQLSNIGVDKTPIAIFRGVFKQRLGEDAPSMRCVNKVSLDRNKPYRAVVNDSVKEFLKIRTICNTCRREQEEGASQCPHCKDKGRIIKASKLYISSRAKELIKFLSKTIFDPADPGGNDFFRGTPKEDHAYDSFKYAFMQLYTPKQKPKDDRPAWLKAVHRQERSKITHDNFMGV